MSDAFFNKPRPFTKRKREDGPNSRNGVAGGRRGVSSSRGSRGGARGGRGSTRGGAGRGRGGSKGGREQERKGKNKEPDEDEELDDPEDNFGGGFDSDSGEGEESEEEEESEEDDDRETPAQKRLRLSQMYLKTLEKETADEDVGFDAADLDRDIIAERLQQDVLEHTGKLHLSVADSLELPIPSSSIYQTPSRGHRGPVTSAVISEDGRWLYTSSKDGSIIKWDSSALLSPPSSTSSFSPPPRITKTVYMAKKPPASKEGAKGKEEKGKAKATTEDTGGHAGEILSIALSSDGKCLASGGADKVIGVWDVEGAEGKWRRGLGGHKDKVGALAFRLGTQQIYSSSFDRTVKLFDLSTLSYVETLFGHQDCIQHVNALRAEVAVTAGGRDKTIRFWKVSEESQLVFRGGVASRVRNILDGAMEDEGIEEETGRRRRARGEIKYVEGSVDVVAMIDDQTFLSGGDSGSICLWNITKKKPVATVQLAHGVDEQVSETEGVISTARWITALACLPYGDTFASGSWDGSIRLWKVDDKLRSITAITSIPALGYINSLQLIAPSLRSTDASAQRTSSKSATKSVIVVAGVGKEPRFGRWMKIKEGKDGAIVAVVPFRD